MEHMHHGSHADLANPHEGLGSAASPAAHDRHAGHSVAMFRDEFWLTLAFTVPVVVWSADVQHWLHHTAPTN